MGGKSSAKRSTKGKGNGRKGGKTQKGGHARAGIAAGHSAGIAAGHSAGNDFRGAEFTDSQVLGHGTMAVKTYVQQYAPVPTALDALPQPPAGFVGREDDIAFILGVLDPGHHGSGRAVAVLSGWGGVGKTTLAYAAGHVAQKQGWYTGVLLVDLRGYDPHPAQAEDALEALLRSLGVRPEHLPPPGAGREALYRSQLNARQTAGERLLVVADNASSVGQVQPLLPPGHHGMIVTSRHSLSGVGRMRTVNRLQPEDAVALLKASLKSNDPDDVRVEEEQEAAERVVLACGYLPLALQITAALLAQDPGQPLSERAEALSQVGDVLDGLNDGERSLRTTFDQSLNRLAPQEQDLFRLLSLNPGPDISTSAAGVLADQPQPATERLLGRLAASHLIERNPAIRGRWQMHDLLRAYAQEQAQTVMARGRVPRRRYDQARDRLIDHYVRQAEAADTLFQLPGRARAPQFADRNQALSWFDAERENLLAAAHANAATQASIDLGFAVVRYLGWRRRHQDLLMASSLTLDACEALEDSDNTPSAWNNLGIALKNLRRFDEAREAHETARTLHHQTGNTDGEASAWNNLGVSLQELRRFDEALQAHETARTLHHQTGNTHGEASAWNNLGIALKNLRRFDEALQAHETARILHHQSGDTHGEASAWNNLGIALQALERFDEALHAHQADLEHCRQTGDTRGEAISLNNLGTAYRGLNDFDRAIPAGRRAVELMAATEDWFRTGEAWGELATTLRAAGADLSQVREAWEQSASAYARADADEEAAVSRAHADSPGTPE
ncbi:tetratricopeptide repeat protein (plasmid) [Streptomyces sp. NBC_00876]|uniref:ATP-binding protein n=1 Tax=Streptomyces sp. NBC_00876 TaxID=2975853 RepID=UPI002F915865|nr:tetratricopeptide repeat protein [Streptomyces sp. NBC_00876]